MWAAMLACGVSLEKCPLLAILSFTYNLEKMYMYTVYMYSYLLWERFEMGV
jgi:hypothetical protein